MMHVSRVVYPLHLFSSTTLLYLFNQLDTSNQSYTLKRISDPSPTLSGNEIYLEGRFEVPFISTTTSRSGLPIAIRFELEQEQLSTILKNLHLFSCYYIGNPYLIFIGVTLIPIKEVLAKLHLPSKEAIVQQLFRSTLISKIKPLLAVKPKGIIYSRRTFIEFVYPVHPPDILAEWLNLLSQKLLNLEAYESLVQKSIVKQNETILQPISNLNTMNGNYNSTPPHEDPNLPFLLSRALRYSGITSV